MTEIPWVWGWLHNCISLLKCIERYMYRIWILWHIKLYLPEPDINKITSLGRPSGSASRMCDSGSRGHEFQPNVGCRADLKIKSLLNHFSFPQGLTLEIHLHPYFSGRSRKEREREEHLPAVLGGLAEGPRCCVTVLSAQDPPLSQGSGWAFQLC